MRLEKALLGSTVADLRVDLEALRSAKARAGRRRRDRRAEAAHEKDSRRAKRRRERELEELLRIRKLVRVPPERKPRVAALMRRLRNDGSGFLPGEVGRSDSRGADGFYSLYFEFTARGLKPRSGKRWRGGEAKRAVLYIIAEDGLETPERGWLSNVGTEPAEVAALMDLLEDIAREERANANVYISEIIAFPAELTPEQRREALADICIFFEERGLPYVAAPHKPSAAGDQRNFHAHIIYARRQVERLGSYEWRIGLDQDSTINTPAGIKERRLDAVACLNRSLAAAGLPKRYTAVPRSERGLGRGEAKRGQGQTAALRRLAALEAEEELLARCAVAVAGAIDLFTRTATRMDEMRRRTPERLQQMRGTEVPKLGDRQSKVVERCRAIKARSSTDDRDALLGVLRRKALAMSEAEGTRQKVESLRRRQQTLLGCDLAAERRRLLSAGGATAEVLNKLRTAAGPRVATAPEAVAGAKGKVRLVLLKRRSSAETSMERARSSVDVRVGRADALGRVIAKRDRLAVTEAQPFAARARLAGLTEEARQREAAAARKGARERLHARRAECEALTSSRNAAVAERQQRMRETWSILRTRILRKLEQADRRPVLLADGRPVVAAGVLAPQEEAFFRSFGADLSEKLRELNASWDQRQSREAVARRDRTAFEEMMRHIDTQGFTIIEDPATGRLHVNDASPDWVAMLSSPLFAEEADARLREIVRCNEVAQLICHIRDATVEPGAMAIRDEVVTFPNFDEGQTALLTKHRLEEDVMTALAVVRDLIEEQYRSVLAQGQFQSKNTPSQRS